MRPLTTDTRWMRIFIAVGVLVVLVVAGFLIAIVHSLDAIDSGLGEANTAVTSVKGNVEPLATLIADINGNLAPIRDALKPIPDQATAIDGSLTVINGSLTSVNGSLVNTSGLLSSTSGSLSGTTGTLGTISGSLSGTSGTLNNTEGTLRTISGSLGDTSRSLSGTSGVLVSVKGLLDSINTTLISAERPGSTNGTAQIPINVQAVNAILLPARQDADSILSGLTSVNAHLSSICGAKVLSNPVVSLAGLVNASAPC